MEEKKTLSGLLDEAAKELRNQIIAGEFEFIKFDDCTATLKIEGISFEVWIANDPKCNFDVYSAYSLIHHGYTVFKTQKERMAGWRMVKPYVVKHLEKVALREKKAALKKLQKEIDKLQAD